MRPLLQRPHSFSNTALPKRLESYRHHQAEQIVNKLRQAEVEQSRGLTVAEACRKIAVTEQAYYRRRKEYGGLKRDQARRMKEFEHENMRLKRLVADLNLDKAILEEAAKENF